MLTNNSFVLLQGQFREDNFSEAMTVLQNSAITTVRRPTGHLLVFSTDDEKTTSRKRLLY